MFLSGRSRNEDPDLSRAASRRKRFLCCVEVAPNLYDQTLSGVCCRNDDERLEMTYKIKSTQDNKSMGNMDERLSK